MSNREINERLADLESMRVSLVLKLRDGVMDIDLDGILIAGDALHGDFLTSDELEIVVRMALKGIVIKLELL